MYGSAFSKMYNDYGWNTFAESFAIQLLQWIDKEQLTIHTALDIGCGTGVLCRVLKDAGIETAGVDLSENMLEFARKNCPDTVFTAADVVTYRPEKQFDLITATGDVLNHIPDLKDVQKVFNNVYESLGSGGIFIFDIMSCSELKDGDSFELGDSNRFEFERHDKNTIMMRISADDVNGVVTQETVTETIHDPEELKRMLKKSGFENVQYVRQLLPEYEHPEGALYFIAFTRE